jgi:hypothetical protein
MHLCVVSGVVWILGSFIVAFFEMPVIRRYLLEGGVLARPIHALFHLPHLSLHVGRYVLGCSF